ncbi:hypothetical protein AB0I22_25205 [Streptomyces sp. NPDC050610]|uniref:hypothetical protein n=1 Tax=Streptomyces sp. NPDC050610 TaxID=3157097 RepID=UPI0034198E66
MVTHADVGHRVADEAGCVFVLRDLLPDYEDPADPPNKRRKRPTAFVAPERGGVERLVSPEAVFRA